MTKNRGGRDFGSLKATAVGVTAFCVASAAQAFKFDTDSDWDVNLDNSLQWTMGWRAQSLNPKIGNNLAYSQGDYKFPNEGDMVTNRVQDLIEFQAVYRKDQGFRLTASIWDDFAYNDDAKNNPAFPASFNAYPSGHYSGYTDRYFLHSGELLDAFGFLNTDINGTPVYLKAGRLTQYWGNAFFFGFSNIAYSQHPIDYIKGFSQPGSEVKELFLPRSQILASTELSPELSVTAQYFFEYEPNRYPESGTYLGFVNFLFNGPPGTGPLGAAGITKNDGIVQPSNNNGNYGLKVAWSPEWAGGDMGFYYRQFDDVHPWLLLVNPTNGHLQDTVAQHSKLIGFSFEKAFGPVSTGLEINQRLNTALATTALVPANEGAKGKITNVIGNAFVQLGKSPIWDAGTLLAEFSYTHLNHVSSNNSLYNGENTKNCVDVTTGGKGSWKDGCATDNAVAFATLFTPQWLQVAPSWDLEMPVSYTWGIHGNPAYAAGSFYAQGTNLYSVGVKGIYQSKNSVLLQYNGYRWRPNETGDNGLGMPTWVSGNGAVALNDRGWWQLQFKTSF